MEICFMGYQEGIKLSSIDRFWDIPGVSMCFECSWKLGTKYLMYISEKIRALLPQYARIATTCRLPSREGRMARVYDHY